MEEYRDKKYGFSLAIPPGWNRIQLRFIFWLTGGRLAIANSKNFIQLNISVGKVKSPELHDKKQRANKFLEFRANTVDRPIHSVTINLDEPLGSEENTARVDYYEKAMAGIDGKTPIDRRCGFVSTVHNGKEYVMQWAARKPAPSDMSNSEEDVINSFRFDNL